MSTTSHYFKRYFMTLLLMTLTTPGSKILRSEPYVITSRSFNRALRDCFQQKAANATSRHPINEVTKLLLPDDTALLEDISDPSSRKEQCHAFITAMHVEDNSPPDDDFHTMLCSSCYQLTLLSYLKPCTTTRSQ